MLISWKWFLKFGFTIGVLDGIVRFTIGIFRVDIRSFAEGLFGLAGVMFGTVSVDIFLIGIVGYFIYRAAVHWELFLHKPIESDKE